MLQLRLVLKTLRDLTEARHWEPDGLVQILVLLLVSQGTLGKFLISMGFHSSICSVGTLVLLCSLSCLYF